MDMGAEYVQLKVLLNLANKADQLQIGQPNFGRLGFIHFNCNWFVLSKC